MTQPNDLRPLDRVDGEIVRQLAADARVPNNLLAERVGIAASTCITRVRSLQQRGVIRGYHADVDPAALGRPIQAMIAVRLHSRARGQLSEFAAALAEMPEVLNIFFLAGAVDYYVQIAARSTEHLRDFVVNVLSANPSVASTETNLVFEHLRGHATV